MPAALTESRPARLALLLSKQSRSSRSSRPQPLRLYLVQTEAYDNAS